MSTPRKQLPKVALEQVLAAEKAIAYASTLSQQASRLRMQVIAELKAIEDLDIIKRRPNHIRDVLLLATRTQTEAERLEAEARAAISEAEKFMLAAQVAHKFVDDE